MLGDMGDNISARGLIEKSLGTVYAFEDRYVVHLKKDSAIRGVDETGEFRTGRLIIKYIIKNQNGSRSMVLGETDKGYSIAVSPVEINAIRQAILYIAEKERLKILQSRSKPDYGFEQLVISYPAIKVVAISKSKK